MAKLTFKTDNCKGCGLCVDACPKLEGRFMAMFLSPKASK